MKVAIVGSRTFSDLEAVRELVHGFEPGTVLVSGGARGVDSVAEKTQKKLSREDLIFDPDWAKYGRAAGPIRNAQIVDVCDEMHAFWDGASRGTKNAMQLCEKAGKPLTVHMENGRTYDNGIHPMTHGAMDEPLVRRLPILEVRDPWEGVED